MYKTWIIVSAVRINALRIKKRDVRILEQIEPKIMKMFPKEEKTGLRTPSFETGQYF